MRNKNFYIISLLLFATGFSLYSHTLQYPFILDDFQQIVHNPFVHDISAIYKHFTGSSVYDANSGLGGIYYKPIMQILYSFCWQIGNGTTLPFRLLQLILHIINSILLFSLISTLITKYDEKNFPTLKQLTLSFIVAVTFLIHPINSEAVLFIADLQEPLYTFWGLSLLLVASNFKPQIKDILLVFILSLLSLLSKETGLLYTLALIGFIYLFKKDHLKVICSIAVTSILTYSFLRFYVANLPISKPSDLIISNIDTINRIITIPKVLYHYIYLFFYPLDISLTQDWYVKTINFTDFIFPSFAVTAILITLCLYIAKEKSKIFLFFNLIFLLGWGLHSQLYPLDGTVSDRWFYFSIQGFSFIFFYIVIKNIKVHISYLISFFILISIALGYRTYLRTLDWRSSSALFQADIKTNPHSFYLNNNIGLDLLSQQKYDEAANYFQNAIQNSIENTDSWAIATTNLAAVFYLQQKYSEAIRIAQKAMPVKNIKTLRLVCASYIDLQQFDFAKDCLSFSLKEYPEDLSLNRYLNTLESHLKTIKDIKNQ